jgi:hypothetical protein
LRAIGTAGLGLIAVLALSACGSPPPLSLVQLRTRATAICTATSRRTGRLAPPASAPAAASFLERGADLLAAESRQLRALHAPAADATAFTRALADLDATIAGLRAGAGALRQGDPAIEVKQFQPRIAQLEARQDQSWQVLGIPACAAH